MKQLRLVSPNHLDEAVRAGRLHQALVQIASLADAELTFESSAAYSSDSKQTPPADPGLPIHYRQKPVGRVVVGGDGDDKRLARAARAITSVMEHAVDREVAVGDLAEEMIACYDELNMLYALLPNIATRVHARDVAEALVDETARTLHCNRVSLLILDESRKNLKVLASRGLPEHVQRLTIPLDGTISGRAINSDDLLVVNDAAQRSDLFELSSGQYASDAFVVARVPLQAQGEAVGVLTATDRIDSSEFTARDQKLFEGLASMGASALLNCRLHSQINRQMVSTIRALASAIDAKDQYTHSHSARVAQLCVSTAHELGMHDAGTCREVELAGLLHDIGKIGIPDAILGKAGRLNPQEFVRVRKHAEIGASIVQHVEGLENVAKGIRHHHERYDGLGYPAGLHRDAIPITSRMISVADVFDVLVSERPYRKAIGTEKALLELKKCRGAQFDPAVVDAFHRVIEKEGFHDPAENQGAKAATVEVSRNLS